MPSTMAPPVRTLSCPLSAEDVDAIQALSVAYQLSDLREGVLSGPLPPAAVVSRALAFASQHSVRREERDKKSAMRVVLCWGADARNPKGRSVLVPHEYNDRLWPRCLVLPCEPDGAPLVVNEEVLRDVRTINTTGRRDPADVGLLDRYLAAQVPGRRLSDPLAFAAEDALRLPGEK